MKIAILCSDPAHPVMPSLRQWQADRQAEGHEVSLLRDKVELTRGDILFLVSCAQIIRPADRAGYRAALVLHASDLPRGRGWSPHIWAVLGGQSDITLCLLEASEPVDSGRVWLRARFTLEGHELLPEINAKLFAAEMQLMTEAVGRFDTIQPEAQTGEPGPYLRRRTPADSRIEPDRTIAEQFELLRVIDNERYPAFMEFRGKRYRIKIEKIDDAPKP
jgi:methionyl-tRNA formyltransferase